MESPQNSNKKSIQRRGVKALTKTILKRELDRISDNSHARPLSKEELECISLIAKTLTIVETRLPSELNPPKKDRLSQEESQVLVKLLKKS